MYNLKRIISRKSRTQQTGASLIELMVGITIGMLIVIAAVGTLMFTSLSSSASTDNNRLQQKAELFFRLFRLPVEQAGAMSIASPSGNYEVEFSKDFTGLPTSLTGLPSTTQASAFGVNATGTAADTLNVAYQHEGDGRDCLGNTPPAADANKRIQNRYSVNAATLELLCEGGNAVTGAQAIIDGVEDFQVVYGIKTFPSDTPLDPTTYTYRFYRADQVTNWDAISAVSICLQLRGDSTSSPSVGTLPIGCAGTAMPSDGRLRRAYTRIYSFRNALL
ncbi:MAG: PilW family protein [Burkholderiaceae bacterium]